MLGHLARRRRLGAKNAHAGSRFSAWLGGLNGAVMVIRTRAFARAGLIGNPSDGYFGKTISFIVGNFSAKVTVYESPRLTILPQRSDRLEFASFGELLEDVHIHGYYGGIRLIKAAIKRFGDYCAQVNVPIDRNFSIEYETDIPIRVGLAGSSAIITATMRALMEFFQVEIPGLSFPASSSVWSWTN